MTTKRRLPTKKIMVAAIGVATVSYGCLTSDATTNGTPTDGGADGQISSSGNLMAPADSGGKDTAAQDTGPDISVSGNLMPPPDSGSDAAADAPKDAPNDGG
jgi:hypothetical protein